MDDSDIALCKRLRMGYPYTDEICAQAAARIEELAKERDEWRSVSELTTELEEMAEQRGMERAAKICRTVATQGRSALRTTYDEGAIDCVRAIRDAISQSHPASPPAAPSPDGPATAP